MSATTRIFYYSECITHQNELFPVIYKCFMAHTQSKMKCIFGKRLKSITTILSNLAGSNFFYIFYSFLIFHKKVKQILGTPCFHLWFFFFSLSFGEKKGISLLNLAIWWLSLASLRYWAINTLRIHSKLLELFLGGNMSSISYQKKY